MDGFDKESRSIIRVALALAAIWMVFLMGTIGTVAFVFIRWLTG